MGFLEKNLSILQRRDASLAGRVRGVPMAAGIETASARSGHPTLKVGGLSLHSTYDPVGEADLQVTRFLTDEPGKGPVVVLGMGLGYHVERLLEAGATPVVVVEPRTDVFGAAMETRNLKGLLTRCRHLFVGQTAEAVVEHLKATRFPFENQRVFVHQPSLRLNQPYFDQLVVKLKTLNILSGLKLDILVVPPIYGGSLPIADYCIKAFKTLGHRATMLDNSMYYPALQAIDETTENVHHRDQLRGSLTQHAAERVMAKCLAVKPDIVFALAQAPLTPNVLERMRTFDFVTAFWFVEDFREFEYWKVVADTYQHFFAIQKEEVFKTSERLDNVDFTYLPLACDPRVHRPLSLSERDRNRFGSDVSFLGAGYPNRQILFHTLVDLDFKIWGTEWDRGSILGRLVQEKGRRITPRESVKIFNAAAINLNLHSSTYHKGINPAGDFVNPRTFEIAGCGGFQLVDPRSHLPELFEPDRELICFENAEDLREKIAYYLARPDERASIAAASHKRTRLDHTYQKRMARVLEIIVERDIDRFTALGETRQKPGRLIAEAGADTELGKFLSRFSGEDHLTLERIVSEIHQGEGELTEPEVIFLLMQEFAKSTGTRP